MVSTFSYENQFSARRAIEVTPSDSADLALNKGIYVGSTGDLVVRMWDDEGQVTFKNVPTGTLLPIRARRIFATGTTATAIVAVL